MNLDVLDLANDVDICILVVLAAVSVDAVPANEADHVHEHWQHQVDLSDVGHDVLFKGGDLVDEVDHNLVVGS